MNGSRFASGGDLRWLVGVLVLVIAAVILVPWAFHLSWAIFGPIGGLLVLILILLLLFG